MQYSGHLRNTTSQHKSVPRMTKQPERILRAQNNVVSESNNKESELNCVLYLTETQLEHEEEEHKWECIDDDGHILDLNLDFDTDYKDPTAGRILSGGTNLRADSAIISDTSAILRGKPKFSLIPNNSRRHLEQITGQRSVLVVRIEANDAFTGPSEKDLARTVFGITDDHGKTDSWNLASGYDQCSYGQLTFEPAQDQNTNNGVYTLSIDANVKGKTHSEVRNLALDRLRSDLGVKDLNSIYDHVMLCLPPGTKTASGKSDNDMMVNGSFNNNLKRQSHERYELILISFLTYFS